MISAYIQTNTHPHLRKTTAIRIQSESVDEMTYVNKCKTNKSCTNSVSNLSLHEIHHTELKDTYMCIELTIMQSISLHSIAKLEIRVNLHGSFITF